MNEKNITDGKINSSTKSTSKTKSDIVKLLLKQDLGDVSEEELINELIDKPLAVDIDKQEDACLTIGDKAADKLSAVAGSWGFIIGFGIFIVFWVVLNVFILSKGVDPYPFILLNLLLSCLAAFQAPIIMMSQNRQSKKDSLRNQNDYRIDLKSELILEELHKEILELKQNQKELLKLIKNQKSDNINK